MHIMKSTVRNNKIADQKTEEQIMNEKAYKTMGLAGGAGIAIGIIVAVVGVTTGIISIISGARLLKERKGLLF